MKLLDALKAFILFSLISIANIASPQNISDKIAFPAKGKIRILPIVNYTLTGSPTTNCYIISGIKGEAIIIDPADQLEQSYEKRILADANTGESVIVDEKELARYKIKHKDQFGEIVIDPGNGNEYFVYDQFSTTNAFGPKIVKALSDNHLKLKYIVITHGHLDHFAALTYLQKKTRAKVLMHQNDLRTLTGGKLTKKTKGSVYPKDSYRIRGLSTKVNRLIDDGDLISLDGMKFQVIHTPGHSPGSICLLTRQDKKTILFSGDTLMHWDYFRDWWGIILRDEKGNPRKWDTGRTNFVDGSGDEALLNSSIRDKLFTLPDDTLVYPAHGEVTTIGEEKKNCPRP